MKTFSGVITEQYKYADDLLEVLNEYGIGIYKIDSDNKNYSPCTRLPDEKDLKEFRVTLGEIFTEEKLEDNWNSKNRKDIDDEYLEDFDKDALNIGKVAYGLNSNGFSDEATFSVFLPTDTKLVDKSDTKKYLMFEKLCLSKAATYLLELKNTVSEAYRNPVLETRDMSDEPIKLGKFCTIHNIQISNRNLEPLFHPIMRRLYEDSKFFYIVQNHLGTSEYKSLINDVLNTL